MATLTYWVAEHSNEGREFSIRGRTKKEVQAMVLGHRSYYLPPRKVSVSYKDALDLVIRCLEEGGGSWE